MTILGTFSALHAQQFPLVVPQIGVYAALTDARGKIPIKLVVVDANEEREPISKQEVEVEFTDPIVVMELVFILTGVTFPMHGEYRLQLYAGIEFVIERRILVLDVHKDQQ